MTGLLESVQKGETIPTDYCGTIETGSVKLTELNDKVAAAGTQEAIDAALAKFKTGELKVFDTATFTVGGKTLTEYAADVNGDGQITVKDVIPIRRYITGGFGVEL